MNIIYIHGHGASANSFNYIRSQIKNHDDICLEYDSARGFASNLAAMVDELKDAQDVFLVGHSLGGLYALHLAGRLGARVRGAVTMATPYGGSEAAVALSIFWPSQLYNDIIPRANPITQGQRITLTQPWTAIVTTKGHSQLMAAANDGVCTMTSMRERKDVEFVDVAATHHEVVLSPRSVAIIKRAIKVAA